MLIVGTGAMACLFSARLAPYARITHLGTWLEGLAALRENGVRIVDPDGKATSYPVEAVEDPAACSGVRFALVLVKSWQTARAAEQLAVCLSPEGLALTIQNGKGNLEILSRGLGGERVALGVTTYGATLLAPGLVRPGGDGIVSLGRHPALGNLAALLRRAFQVEIVEDIEALVWGKLVVNAAINPLTALLEVPNGALLESAEARALMAAVAEETAAVACGAGVSLPFLDPAAQVETVARKTAANDSSMLQDMRRGAPTEIDAICGEIWRTAEAEGIPAPLTRALWQLVRAKVEMRKGIRSESL